MSEALPAAPQPRPPADDEASGSRLPTFGPRSMLVSALVGFGLGVLVTFAFAPLYPQQSPIPTATVGPLPTSAPTDREVLKKQITSLANATIGYNNVGQQRIEEVTPTPAFPPKLAAGEELPMLYDVTITFKLNPNYIGPSTQVRSAKGDVFLLLRALYTHGLPIADVTLIGKFQFPGSPKETSVLRAEITQLTAQTVPWGRLGRKDEQRVWLRLDRHQISHAFEIYKAHPHS